MEKPDTKHRIRILHLEDSPRDAELIRERLEGDGLACEITHVDNRELFEAALARDAFDLILCDYSLPNYGGREAVAHVQETRPGMPVIVITGTLLDEEAVECLKLGAADYLLKAHLSRLEPAVRRAIQEAEERRERQTAEAALRESEQRFQELAQNSSDVFWFFAAHPERTLYVSPAAESVWNTPMARLEQNPRAWLSAIHPEDRARVREAYDAWLADRIPRFDEECRFVQPDGSVRWVVNSGTLIRSEAGDIVRLSGVSRDITDRKRAEEAEASKREQADRLRNLEETLEHYSGLSSAGVATSIARELAGAAPVRQRVPEVFAALRRAYRSLLDEYLDQLIVKAPKPLKHMQEIVNQLGDLAGGPRDLLDVHLEALQEAAQSQNIARTKAYTVDGRLLALEMMGLLADHYRVGGSYSKRKEKQS